MDRKKPDVIDAEFEVIEPAQPRLKWWQGWRLGFDWRVFAMVALSSLAGLIARLTEAWR
jgi:hypothetical protein